jgi:hypothetical protein
VASLLASAANMAAATILVSVLAFSVIPIVAGLVSHVGASLEFQTFGEMAT